jgi:hypothetical protein
MAETVVDMGPEQQSAPGEGVFAQGAKRSRRFTTRESSAAYVQLPTGPENPLGLTAAESDQEACAFSYASRTSAETRPRLLTSRPWD